MASNKITNVFNTNNDYAGLTTELPFIIRTAFKQYGKFPEFAVHLLCVLIGKTQKINNRNEHGEVKAYEGSTRDLAKMANEHQTTVQRAVTWLKTKGWLNVEKGTDVANKVKYVLDIEKINDAISQHQYD